MPVSKQLLRGGSFSDTRAVYLPLLHLIRDQHHCRYRHLPRRHCRHFQPWDDPLEDRYLRLLALHPKIAVVEEDVTSGKVREIELLMSKVR